MNRKLIPFRRWHYEWIEESIEPGAFRLHESVLAQLERENSWTGVVDGAVIFCGGTVRQWPTRHTTWALLAPAAKEHTLWLTRTVREKLTLVNGRLEVTVRTDFPQGMKWVKLLGFRVETPLLKQFGPEGEDHVGFVRIN